MGVNDYETRQSSLLYVFVLVFCLWPCTKHNSCLLRIEERLCRVLQHKSWHLCLLLWCLPGFTTSLFYKLWFPSDWMKLGGHVNGAVRKRHYGNIGLEYRISNVEYRPVNSTKRNWNWNDHVNDVTWHKNGTCSFFHLPVILFNAL